MEKQDIFNQIMLSDYSFYESFGVGSILHYEEDYSSKVYFLIDGDIKAYKMIDNKELFISSFVYYDLVTDLRDASSYSVECLTDCKVLAISKSDLFKLLNAETVAFLFSCNMQLLNHVLNMNLVYSSFQRVSYLLVYSLKHFNSHKRKDIASQINMTQETLSRILRKLRLKGLIVVKDGLVGGVNSDKLIVDYSL